MIERITGIWDWFIGGLAEAASWAIDRLRPTPVYRLEIEPGAAPVRNEAGAEIGRIAEAGPGERFDPPDLAIRLVGTIIDIGIPAPWLFRRTLDPVAQESVPFLDAFVRHQIERITPWRATDVHYQIHQSPFPGDPKRVAIDIGLVPMRLLDPWIAALTPLKPKLLRIGTQGEADEGRRVAIVLGQDSSKRLGRLRQIVTPVLISVGLGYCVVMAWLWWQAGQIRDEIEAQDRVIGERRAVLARARHPDPASQGIDARLQALRSAQLKAVDVIESLARALPDTAHLTEFELQKDHLTIAGISTDMSVLVPALETSGRFADVAFGAATTKVESEAADRFHLDMRVVGRVASQP